MLAPVVAEGHAFGQRYDLPLPLSLYLGAAGAAVALSFVVAGCFSRRRRGRSRYEKSLRDTWIARIAFSRPVTAIVRVVSIGLFALVILTGLIGAQRPTENFAPVFVWVIWWVGMAYLAALLGNVWAAFNPWRNLFVVLEAWFPTLAEPLRRYPDAWSQWPALGLFFVFAWLEMISDAGEHPRTLALLVIVYCTIMMAGMRIYGRDVFLNNADAFTVVFSLLGRFGVFRGDTERRELTLRPIGAGLYNATPLPVSTLAFVLLMLTTVSFDGITETPFWQALVGAVAESRALRPALLEMQSQGVDLLSVVKLVGLLLLYGIFWIVYLAFCAFIAALAGDRHRWLHTARLYVLGLVPIAIAYHLAHYISYLLLAGQLMIPLASDPFGFGWNLFGSATRSIDISVVNAKDVWYVSVGAIVTGHVISVYLAHATAIEVTRTTARAIRSQLPMLVLMVAYTVLSLWILSQPIVND